MESTFIYPRDLVPKLRKLWHLRVPPPQDALLDTVPDALLVRLMEVAYHSTFRTEEERRTRFRLLYSPCNVVEASHAGVTTLFMQDRPFSEGEISQLAQAADPARVAIGVSTPDTDDHSLCIWGLVDSGSAWYDFTSGEANLRGDLEFRTSLPSFLTILATEPGSLSVTCGEFTVMTLRGGRLLEPLDILDQGPVFNLLKGAIEQTCVELSVLYDFPLSKVQNVELVYLQYLKKVLQRIRERGHGGTLLVVPDQWMSLDATLYGRLRIKYACIRARAREMLLESLILNYQYQQLNAAMCNQSLIALEDYREVAALLAQREQIDAALSDSVNFLAGLSGVDGAVVITDRFRLMGFGAMVTVPSTLKQVLIAYDIWGKACSPISVESYGARHGAAFRFCESCDEAVAFVASQDGGIKAVQKLGEDVLLWEDVDLSL